MTRVLVVRHGMGSHNSYKGMGSIMNEDAELTSCGAAQARAVGSRMRSAGVIGAVDVAVVSPFTRTLQTAAYLLGEDIGSPTDFNSAARAERFGHDLAPTAASGRPGPVETVVQPLCAEDTMARSHLCRGNRGSTAEELARRPEFSGVFDWGELVRYCEARRVAAKDASQAGKWWHHGPHDRETEGSFQRRMVRLRKWLGALALRAGPAAPGVLLVTHGGVMEEGFGYRPAAPNCAFRAFDVAPGGATLHISSNAWLEDSTVPDPVFQVYAVVRNESRSAGHHVYDVELGLGLETFTKTFRESQLRTTVHDVVKERLPRDTYSLLRLAGKFPRHAPCGRVPPDPSIHIQDYLEQLAVAMGNCGFAGGLARHVDEALLGGRLFHTHEEHGKSAGPCLAS